MLGDLQLQEARREAGLLQDRHHVTHRLPVGELHRSQVDGHHRRPDQAGPPDLTLDARLLEDGVTEDGDQATTLGEGKELVGAEQPVLGV